MNTSVAVVILNTNRMDDTLRCIASVYTSYYGEHGCEIYVIDNGCTDGSNSAIKSAFPRVNIISTLVDEGYAGNNNYGIFASNISSKYLFIVNEDAYFLEDALGTLIHYMECNDTVGIIGPMIVNESNTGVVQANGCVLNRDFTVYWRDCNQRVEMLEQQAEAVDWVHGCGFMIRTSLFLELGGFWKELYYTWEEVDICVRAKGLGYGVMVHPAAKLAHRDNPGKPGIRNQYYMSRNRLLFMKRHADTLLFVREYARIARKAIKSSVTTGWRSAQPLWCSLIDVVLKSTGKCRWF